MKLTKIASIFVLATSMASAGAFAAADQGAGSVTFTGSIIDAPCSISPDSSDQEVDLGQVAMHELKDNGSSKPRNFQIQLENCDLSEGNQVQVTFGGSAADAEKTLLGITGTASGAGVAMTDGSGSRITLNQATAARDLIEGDNTLGFSAYLQGLDQIYIGDDEDDKPIYETTAIKTGEFNAITNFTLAYE